MPWGENPVLPRTSFGTWPAHSAQIAPFFGYLGAASALAFSCARSALLGAGWGGGSAHALVASLLLALDPPLTRKPFTRRAGFGAAYGTAKSGVGIASMGVLRPDLVIKSIIPVVMAGVLGIYGLIIAVIISTGSECRVEGCVGLIAGRMGEQMDEWRERGVQGWHLLGAGMSQYEGRGLHAWQPG